MRARATARTCTHALLHCALARPRKHAGWNWGLGVWHRRGDEEAHAGHAWQDVSKQERATLCAD
eukprot:10614314-Alexandrium_andersonii.AAC.1